MTESGNHRITINLVTHCAETDAWSLYLVEDGPWPDADLQSRLVSLQQRLYDAIDVALDGHLARKYPESDGRHVRIQVDVHGSAPAQVESFVRRFQHHVATDPELTRDIEASTHVASLCVTFKDLSPPANGE